MGIHTKKHPKNRNKTTITPPSQTEKKTTNFANTKKEKKKLFILQK